MKNKIYYLGLIASMITTCGCFFKIMHWPLAGILLGTGLLMLALLFLPLAIGSLYRVETNKKLKTFYILVAIVLAVNFISALFKIMHWPNAGLLLMISLPLPFVVLLPVFLLLNPDDKLINYKNFLAVLFFFAYYAAVTALLSFGVSKNVIDRMVRSASYLEQQTAALSGNLNCLGIEPKGDIEEEARKLCNKIEEIKKTLMMKDSVPDSRPDIGLSPVTELKNDINDFRILLQKNCKPGDEAFNYYNEIFNTQDDDAKGLRWEQLLFKDQILVSAIEELDLLQFRVRLAAFEAVSSQIPG